MGRDCREYEMEVASAGGGELPAVVAEHILHCEPCSRLRTAALALADAVADREPPISEETAVALARSALRGSRQRARKAPLWAVPLLSASASAAALILFFGLTPGPATGAGEDEPRSRRGVATSLAPALSEASDTTLPDGLRATSELLLGSGWRVDRR